MSDTDPYAAPNVEEAKTSVPEAVEAPVEAQEAPVTEEQTVPEGSVKEVLGWVAEDPTKAKAALDAETSGEKRKTLVKELNAILEK
jgi:hypothetical protein